MKTIIVFIIAVFSCFCQALQTDRNKPFRQRNCMINLKAERAVGATVAHLTYIQGAIGSNPIPPKTFQQLEPGLLFVETYSALRQSLPERLHTLNSGRCLIQIQAVQRFHFLKLQEPFVCDMRVVQVKAAQSGHGSK